MIRLLVLVLVLGAMGCATSGERKVRARPDNMVSQMVPSLHSMVPTRPSDDAVGAPALPPDEDHPRRFDAESVTVEEPGFHEVHSLAWQREVQAYTANTLQREADPLPPGAPLATRARFTWTEDHRDFLGGRTATIDLETALPDGRVVTSEPVHGDIVHVGQRTIFIAGIASMMSALGISLGAISAVVFLAVPITALVLTISVLPAIVGFAILGIGVLDEVRTMHATQQRWSDLYLKALRAHAADVRRVLVDDGVPR